MTPDDAVREIALALPNGTSARILTLGATVRDLLVATPRGPRRVVLGFADAAAYRVNDAYLGVTAGRHANRIAAGRFSLDGHDHRLTLNEGGRTHLHGGAIGFSRRDWSLVEAAADRVSLALVSPDGEEGYPGTVTASVGYTLRAPATLRIEMTATTDAPTILSLAHHSYFNLAGAGDVRDHRLRIAAGRYTPVDAALIPTGEIAEVAGTRFDFRAPRAVSAEGDGVLDHNFVLDRASTDGELAFAAGLEAPGSDAALEVWTSAPGLQVYDGSYLAPTAPPLGSVAHAPHAGICLEPQLFPDGPNRPAFPSPVLRPGERFRQITEYRFG